VKDSEQIRAAFCQAVASFRTDAAANGWRIIEERILYPKTGPYAVIAIAGEPAELKRSGVAIETTSDSARLYDIDVFAADGEQVSRCNLGLPERTCFICEKQAVICMRERNHTIDELMQTTNRRLVISAAEQTDPWPQPVWTIGAWAVEAMLMEAACTPSPGLVDTDNSGAHQDMDFFTFISSSSALTGAMLRCAAAGWNHREGDADLLPVLRQIGIAGELAMFQTTQDVNTQKGLLFLLGILSAAAAMSIRQDPARRAADIFLRVSMICEGIVERELGRLRLEKQPHKLTAGERLYLEQGVTGIRGEMEAGLPGIRMHGLPALRQALEQGLTLNDSLVHSLIHLMLAVEDSTVLNRHGMSGLLVVKQEARQAVDAGGMLTAAGRKHILEMDKLFIAKNISPGGVADLLAATYFIHLLSTRPVDR
jgi:holo-ACP synthase/triphosphoribosyl-dephospho-CoA synthase